MNERQQNIDAIHLLKSALETFSALQDNAGIETIKAKMLELISKL